jgi:hypothetical protein
VFESCPKDDFESSLAGSNSNSSLASSSTSEEDIKSEMPFHILLSPERYNNYDIPRRTVCYREDAYSSLFERPPKKQVSVGPDYQAVIPEWTLYDRTQHSDFSGTCVIPMPQLESSACISDKAGDGRRNCCCVDLGSVSCVRQHINESREYMLRSLGEERFSELGFNDMGEIVAERWSEEEEQLFHEVVYSNPVSLGKNFWNHLSVMFPFRTKKEIVSYYFNVFMLRKRAEQNRNNLLDIDSDNDEWQGSDDEGEVSDEDEDSVVESPAYDDDHVLGHNEFLYSDSIFQKNPSAEMRESGLCKASDAVAAPQGSQVCVENSRRWNSSFNGTCGVTDRGFVMDGCDAKEWDIGYLSRVKKEVDFLPTCSMIEEVFGVGSWGCDARDGQGLS